MQNIVEELQKSLEDQTQKYYSLNSIVQQEREKTAKMYQPDEICKIAEILESVQLDGDEENEYDLISKVYSKSKLLVDENRKLH